MTRGKHTITGKRPTPITQPSSSGGGVWGIIVLAIVVLAVFLLAGCGKKNEEALMPAPPAAGLFVETPALPEQPSSAPERPHPPRAKLALIQAIEPVTQREPIAVILGGGEYEISYETAENIPDRQTLGTDKVFFADYTKGITSGDPSSAEVYVLIGSLKLQIGDIAESDHLYANILSRGKDVNAYFNYANSERGPPAVMEKRRVIVVGELETIGLPARFGSSLNDVDHLDLNPSEHSEREYQASLAKYEADVAIHRAKMDAWREANAGREASPDLTAMDHFGVRQTGDAGSSFSRSAPVRTPSRPAPRGRP